MCTAMDSPPCNAETQEDILAKIDSRKVRYTEHMPSLIFITDPRVQETYKYEYQVLDQIVTTGSLVIIYFCVLIFMIFHGFLFFTSPE